MVENTEFQDSKNPDEEEETFKPQELSGTPEEQIAQLKEKQQGLYERFKKSKVKISSLETELNTLNEKTVEKKPEEPPKQEDKTAKTLSEAKDYARLIAQGYSDEELEILEKYRGDKSILEVAKELSPVIEKMRADKKSQQQTLSPSARTSSPQKEEKPKTTQERAEELEKRVSEAKGTKV